MLRLLAERGSVSLQQLTTVLGASEPTVRRDLTRLEDEGLLERVHGGARPVAGAKKTLSGQQPFESTLLQYGEWKRRIGREAARLVEENESDHRHRRKHHVRVGRAARRPQPTSVDHFAAPR